MDFSPAGKAITAVLFCAGRGERLRPLTDSVAKPALPIGGRPLASYALDVLRGLEGRLAVNVSWLHESVKAALEAHVPDGTEWLVELPAPLGTAGTLAALLPQLAPSFVVMNGDTITDLSVMDLVASHRRLGGGGTLAVQEVESGADFQVEGDRAIRMILRRGEPDASGVRYLGAAVLEREVVAPHLAGVQPPAGLAEAVFEPMTSDGAVFVHRHDGIALDVGTPAALAEARLFVESGAPELR